MAFTILINPSSPSGTSVEEESVSGLIREGVISASTQIWDADQGRWIDARQHPQLQEFFAQSLWDAWEEDSKIILRSSVRSEPRTEKGRETDAETKADNKKEDMVPIDLFPAEISSEVNPSPEASEVMQDEDVQENEIGSAGEDLILELEEIVLEDLEPDRAAPQAIRNEGETELPLLSESSLIPLAEVSSHQSQSPARMTPQFQTMKTPPRRVRPMTPSEPSQFSAVRVALPILIGSILIFGLLQLMQSYSQTSYQKQERMVAAPKSNQQKIWPVEEEIREVVGDDCLKISPEASFEDILQVELQRARLPAIQIRAAVTEWTGRKLDQPKNIRVRVRVESTGELARDVATFGLIIGKYIETYFLDVEALELCLAVSDEEYLCADLKAEIIRRYYLKRISHSTFFETVFVEE